MKIVIIGGVAGGMSAATRLRRLMEDAEIVVMEKGPFVSFANCGLPYYVSGEIAEREQLLVQTPEALKSRFNLDVRPHHEVVAIDPIEKVITVKHETEILTEHYDKLILSPGAKPFVPPITGLAEAKNVFSLRNVPDLDQIMTALTPETKRAVVIGAGFIGLEMAENLQKRGLEVTLVEKAPHVLPPLDSDLTILSVGVQPENTLAVEAGVATGLRGGIVVDEHYQTNQPDIYAVGDAIVVKQQITQEDALISLASPANRQGRQVADVIAGLERKNQGSIGTAIVRVFDLTAASTGLSERAAKAAGLTTAVVHISGKDHAGYYPGATDLQLKLVFHPTTGEIYGAQGIGAKGVDKRIDILATAIKGQLTIFDLPELEFTYAPPFGSAKDPVNMLGYAAMNLVEGLSENVQWHELSNELAKGAVLLDVRNPAERANGQFKNVVSIPLNELRERLEELDKSTEYIVSCHSGLRSYIAERMLKQAGISAKNLDGAFALYRMVKPEELENV